MMTLPRTPRRLHALLSVLIVGPLLSTALTGALYKFLRVVLLVPKDQTKWLMRLHQFSYLPFSSVLYTSFLFLGVSILAASGWTMIHYSIRKPSTKRQLHNITAAFFFVFLVSTATSGWAYRFSRNVLGLEKTQVSWLLKVHMCNLVCGAIVVLSITGLTLSPQLRGKFSFLRSPRFKPVSLQSSSPPSSP